ncbi:MAG: type II toxin-antitoxin system RelE/ParE family toxin [Deltaproteobacteria bacterium]|nr:MAG: type II toxin-antitoxin system RelE/ParE family toxin [Deltaproteobacteria bacterium]
MKICYTDQARTDVESAFTWYELQQKGLGLQFLLHLETAIEQILEFPETGAPIHGPLRRKLTRKFPFSVFYSIEKEQIVIHAVFDNRKDPKKKPDSGSESDLKA